GPSGRGGTASRSSRASARWASRTWSGSWENGTETDAGRTGHVAAVGLHHGRQLLRRVSPDPALSCRSADRGDGAANPRAQPVRRDHLRMETLMPETNQERAIGRLEGKMDSLIEAVKTQGEKSDAS